MRPRRGRARALEGATSPTPLPLTRATFIRATPFADDRAAVAWLESISADHELWGPLAAEATLQINRALHVHRTATGDPYLADVHPARAVAVRFGFGSGDEVADGRWQAARELSERDRLKLPGRDLEALRPQERIAAVLAGREQVGPHEELIVRARGDLDAGRLATAALGLHAGLEALTRAGATQVDDERAARLTEAAALARSARQRVLEGGEPAADDLERALRAVESAMRRRALD
jgi:hypothetical protein